MRNVFIAICILLCVNLVSGLTVNIIRLPGGPPYQYSIEVINDSEPPVEITDFHFSVSMPCQVVGAEPPPGWTLRYALPNSFVEMDANPGAEIPSGGTGTFGVTIDGPCEDASYSLYFTSESGVIPGSEREGPIEGLNVDENATPGKFKLMVSPNPFNSACEITAPAHATIEIYDTQGRRIDSYSCGCSQTRWTWQPTNASLGSGVYLVRARFGPSTSSGTGDRGGESVTKRIVYLK